MSSLSDTTETEQHDGTETTGAPPDTERVAVENELLREQNHRLREEYLRSQQQTYRQSAAGLVLVGLAAVGAGVVFPAVQTVLFALGGTGIFGGILTYALTPERFIAETVSEGIYEAMTTDRTGLLDELGIEGQELYIPAESPTLYIPAVTADRQPPAQLEPPEELSSMFVMSDNGTPGVALTPTGGPLFAAFRRSLSGPLAETPAPLTAQLVDGLVEGFGLVDGVETDVDPTGGRVTVELVGVAYGSVDQLDHPVCSMLAVGLAVGLDTPVWIEIDQTDPPLVTYRWEQTGTATTDE